MKTVRQCTKDKFFHYIVNSVCLISNYPGSQEVLNFAYSIKEIDDEICKIANEDLQNHFDKFFTITAMHKVEKRSELLEFAIMYKEVDDLMSIERIEY